MLVYTDTIEELYGLHETNPQTLSWLVGKYKQKDNNLYTIPVKTSSKLNDE